MHLIDVLGSVAGCLTTLAFLPQVLQTWRSRSAGDLSLIWLATFSSGVLLWLVYGWVLHSWPIVATNVFTFSLVSSLTWFKLRERSARPGTSRGPHRRPYRRGPHGRRARTRRPLPPPPDPGILSPPDEVPMSRPQASR